MAAIRCNVSRFGVGHVTCDKVQTAVYDAGNKADVACQAVQLGNYQGGAMQSASCKGRRQLGSLVAPAGLTLDTLSYDGLPARCSVRLNRTALRL